MSGIAQLQQYQDLEAMRQGEPMPVTMTPEARELAREVGPGIAQSAAELGTMFFPGAGVTDYIGAQPDPFSDELLPSFGENIEQGRYTDAALQALGLGADALIGAGAVASATGVGAKVGIPAMAIGAGANWLTSAIQASRYDRVASSIVRQPEGAASLETLARSVPPEEAADIVRQATQQAETVVQRIAPNLQVPIRVFPDAAAAREETGLDLSNTVRGFYDQDQINIIAAQHMAPEDIETTLWHEITHAGVDRLFAGRADDYRSTLTRIAQSNKRVGERASEWRDGAGQRFYDQVLEETGDATLAAQRTEARAIEEALASLSEKGKFKLQGAREFVASITDIMRSMGLESLANKIENMTDAEAVRFIAQSRRAAQRPGRGGLETGPREMNVGKSAILLPGMKAYTEAEKMLKKGASFNDIAIDTGWFKLPDGGWRFRIPDAGFRLTSNFNTNYVPEPTMTDLSNGLQTGQVNNTVKIGNVIDYPELYDAYPVLRSINFGIIPTNAPFATADGVYIDALDLLMLNRNVFPNIGYSEEVVKHELQHGVQRLEGFVGGGGADTPIVRFSQEDIDNATRDAEVWVSRTYNRPLNSFSPDEIDRFIRYFLYHARHGEGEARVAQIIGPATNNPIKDYYNAWNSMAGGADPFTPASRINFGTTTEKESFMRAERGALTRFDDEGNELATRPFEMGQFREWFGKSVVSSTDQTTGKIIPNRMYLSTPDRAWFSLPGISSMHYADQPTAAAATQMLGPGKYLSIQNPLDMMVAAKTDFEDSQSLGRSITSLIGIKKGFKSQAASVPQDAFFTQLPALARSARADYDAAEGAFATQDGWIRSRQNRELLTQIQKKLLDEGFDGLTYRSNVSGRVYVPFKQNQVISDASDLTKFTVTRDPDIMLSMRPPSIEDLPRPEARRAITPEQDEEYLDAVRRGDEEEAQRLVDQALVQTGRMAFNPEETTAFTVRTAPPPQRTVTRYKAMRLVDGELRPLYVGATEPVPMGVWLDAKEGGYRFQNLKGSMRVPARTGDVTRIPNDQVRQELIENGFLPEGSKATTIRTVAYRPGWHVGSLPYNPQGGGPRDKGYKKGQANPEHPYPHILGPDIVIAEVELAADRADEWTQVFQDTATRTKEGEIQLSRSGVREVPVDGYYDYTTNPNNYDNPGTWSIGGSLKVNRLLTQQEADTIMREQGFTPQRRVANNIDPSTVDVRRYGVGRSVLYDREGNPIPLSRRFSALGVGALAAGVGYSAAEEDVENLRQSLQEYLRNTPAQ